VETSCVSAEELVWDLSGTFLGLIRGLLWVATAPGREECRAARAVCWTVGGWGVTSNKMALCACSCPDATLGVTPGM
jgi:hypothetical protein